MASTGYIVQGWGVDDNGDIVQGSVSNLNVMSKSTYTAAATTSATVSGIVDAEDTNLETKNGKIMNLQVLDNMGYEYNLQFGILPQKIVSSGTRDILNTENEYALSEKLYKVDISKLEYSYDVNGETRILSSADSPDLLTALDKAVWADVSAGKSAHVPGTKDSVVKITIDDAFLTNNNLDLLKYSALKEIGRAHV